MNKIERDVGIEEEEEEEEDCEQGDEGFRPLYANEPFFHAIMTRSHVKPSCNMKFPVKFHATLPSEIIPTLIKYRDKTWKVTYYGSGGQRRFDCNSWRRFVEDNDLQVGDGCVFQLLQCSSSKLIFRLLILRGDIPPQLLHRTSGETADTPIIVE